jgi:hypothetical protein
MMWTVMNDARTTMIPQPKASRRETVQRDAERLHKRTGCCVPGPDDVAGVACCAPQPQPVAITVRR